MIEPINHVTYGDGEYFSVMGEPENVFGEGTEPIGPVGLGKQSYIWFLKDHDEKKTVYRVDGFGMITYSSGSPPVFKEPLDIKRIVKPGYANKLRERLEESFWDYIEWANGLISRDVEEFQVCAKNGAAISAKEKIESVKHKLGLPYAIDEDFHKYLEADPRRMEMVMPFVYDKGIDYYLDLSGIDNKYLFFETVNRRCDAAKECAEMAGRENRIEEIEETRERFLDMAEKNEKRAHLKSWEKSYISGWAMFPPPGFDANTLYK